MRVFFRYQQLPTQKKRALWFLLLGIAFLVYGILGLAGVLHAPGAYYRILNFFTAKI